MNEIEKLDYIIELLKKAEVSKDDEECFIATVDALLNDSDK